MWALIVGRYKFPRVVVSTEGDAEKESIKYSGTKKIIPCEVRIL